MKKDKVVIYRVGDTVKNVKTGRKGIVRKVYTKKKAKERFYPNSFDYFYGVDYGRVGESLEKYKDLEKVLF